MKLRGRGGMLRSRRRRILLLQVSAVLVLLLAMDLLVRFGIVSQLILSSPVDIVRRIADELRGVELLRAVITTAWEFAISSVIAVFVGCLLGFVLFRNQVV